MREEKTTKKPWRGIPYEVEQLLYGVSILLTIGVAGQIAAHL